jgi:hypothetical protein
MMLFHYARLFTAAFAGICLGGALAHAQSPYQTPKQKYLRRWEAENQRDSGVKAKLRQRYERALTAYHAGLGNCSALRSNDAVSQCQETAAETYWKAYREYAHGESEEEGLHAEKVFDIQRQYEWDLAYHYQCCWPAGQQPNIP